MKRRSINILVNAIIHARVVALLKEQPKMAKKDTFRDERIASKKFSSLSKTRLKHSTDIFYF